MFPLEDPFFLEQGKRNEIMNEKQKDVLSRACRTFWQALLAYLLADAAVLQEALRDWSAGKQVLLSLAIGALAAGLSAVYNGVVLPLLEDGHGH